MIIIGVLAIMIAPKLMGAPATARDANRMVSLEMISMALESYYSDHNSYPDSGVGWGCINDTAGSPGAELLDGFYLDAVPKDPVVTNAMLDCTGTFRYISVENQNGFADDAYILAAGMERKQKANVDWNDISGYDNTTSIQDAITVIDTDPDVFGSGDIPAFAIYGR
jgi:type II secretory pathway pseudopilin PulG